MFINFIWIALSVILAAMLLCAVVILCCCASALVSMDEQADLKPEPEMEFDSPSRAESDFVTARLLVEDRKRRRRRPQRRPGNYLIR